MPVIADDGQHVEGWITSHNVLQAVACHIRAAGDGGQQARAAAEQVVPGPRDDPREAPTPLGNYQLIEVTIPAHSPSVGLALGGIAWPTGYFSLLTRVNNLAPAVLAMLVQRCTAIQARHIAHSPRPPYR